MLTDTKLRNDKPQDKLYKVNDRDGLCAAVTPAGAIAFRYNYSINGRQETITFGHYGTVGITLLEAREHLLGETMKMIASGKLPSQGGANIFVTPAEAGVQLVDFYGFRRSPE